MEYLLGGGMLIFGLWALIATVRMSGVKSDNVRLRGDNDTLTTSLATQVAENTDYKKRAQLRIGILMDELESQDDKQHAEIAKIEDPEKRLRRRRAFVSDVMDGVLPEEATSAGSANKALVHREEAPNSPD